MLDPGITFMVSKDTDSDGCGTKDHPIKFSLSLLRPSTDSRALGVIERVRTNDRVRVPCKNSIRDMFSRKKYVPGPFEL